MLRCGLVFAVVLSGCAVELTDVPGRACDDEHPCRAPRTCVSGVCREPVSVVDGGAMDAGSSDGGSTGFDAGPVNDAGMARWQQRLHGFTSTSVDPGCMIDIDPLRGNRVLSTIRSTLDSEDTALAAMVDTTRLPRGAEGRFRGRITLAAPLQLRGFLPVAFVGTQTGQAFVRLGFDELGRLKVESDAQTISTAPVSETFTVAGGFTAGDWIVEVMWRVGVVRQVRINDVLVGDLALSGGATQPPNELSLGPARYDGDGGVPFSLTLSSWQLADELSVVLSE